MSKRGLIRAALWIFIPLIFGIAIGLAASKFHWGYWWVPPTVRINPIAHPTAIASFKIWPALEVRPIAERNKMLGIEFARWSGGYQEECTFVRALLQTPNVEWTTLPMMNESSVRNALESARRLSHIALLKEGQEGTGFVAIYDLHGETLTLVTFKTAELSNDYHGYVEILLRGSGGEASLIDFAVYYYEVSGIEFVTPRVLVLFGIILAFVVAALVAGVRYFSRG